MRVPRRVAMPVSTRATCGCSVGCSTGVEREGVTTVVMSILYHQYDKIPPSGHCDPMIFVSDRLSMRLPYPHTCPERSRKAPILTTLILFTLILSSCGGDQATPSAPSAVT